MFGNATMNTGICLMRSDYLIMWKLTDLPVSETYQTEKLAFFITDVNFSSNNFNQL